MADGSGGWLGGLVIADLLTIGMALTIGALGAAGPTEGSTNMTAANPLPSNERRGDLAVKLGKTAPTGLQAASWRHGSVFLAHSPPQAGRLGFGCRRGTSTLPLEWPGDEAGRRSYGECRLMLDTRGAAGAQ